MSLKAKYRWLGFAHVVGKAVQLQPQRLNSMVPEEELLFDICSRSITRTTN